MPHLVLVAALALAQQAPAAAPPDAGPAADAGAPASADVAPPAAAPAASPGFLDQAQAAHEKKRGNGVVANVFAPGSAEVAAQRAAGVDRLLADAEAALTPPPGPDGKAPAADPKKAIALFQRALKADGARAAPLWGLSRAHDAAGDRRLGLHYARLVQRSNAKDKTPAMATAALWRVEQPQ